MVMMLHGQIPAQIGETCSAGGRRELFVFVNVSCNVGVFE